MPQFFNKVTITGGSGLVGSQITKYLLANGTSVQWLTSSHKSTKGVKAIQWQPYNNDLDASQLAHQDVIFHLAGASVATKRWTAKRKKELFDSRIISTQCLYNSIKSLTPTERPSVIVCASAIGIYGFEGDHVCNEDSPNGSDFLAHLTIRWEREMDRFSELGITVSKFRIGVVLSEKGGALIQLLQPINLYVGASLGSGLQWMPWIHLDDLVQLLVTGAQNKWKGPYNAVTSSHSNNTQITKAIAKLVNKPLWLPNVPAFIMKIMLGEMADMVLNGIRVSSQKTEDKGFTFKYHDLPTALANLLNK